MTPKNFLILLISLTVIFGVSLSIYVYSVVSEGLPSLQQLENPEQMFASQVISNDGEVIDNFYRERRIQVPLKDMSPHVVNALVATEDRKFYEHWGVDIDRIFKSIIKKILSPGERLEGASTITQQLSRNLFLDQSRTVERKLREAAVAVRIEDTYTKDEILEMYLNTVNFGRGARGIYVAAKTYFNKKPNELSISESAYLVGLLKGPANYDTRFHFERGLMRRNLILSMMQGEEYISYSDYNEAREEPLVVTENTAGTVTYSSLAPHFVESIRRDFQEDYNLNEHNLYTDGLLIYTSINKKIQEYANTAVKEHLATYQKKFNRNWKWKYHQKLLKSVLSEAVREHPEYRSASKKDKPDISKKLKSTKRFVDSVKNEVTTIQIGMVVIDPASGAILAMVGASPKFMKENAHAKHSLNHVSQIRRQPGSSMKPFVYASALRTGMTLEDSISCGPFTYVDPITEEEWNPRSGVSDCPDSTDMMTLKEGLRRSVNSVAARLITEVTTPTDVKYLVHKAGVKTPIQAVPALALGAGGEVIPMEHISGFSIFANDGYRVEPYYVSRIEDRNGNIIFRKKRSNKITDVLDKEIAHELTIMLQQVVDRGTAIRVRNHFTGVDAAGKTGTTNDNSDAWFIGYTPQLICGIWVGFDDQRVTFDVIGNDGQGGRVAAPIWGKLMDSIYKDPELPYKQTKFGYKTRTELDSLSKLQKQVGEYFKIIN